MVKLAMIAIQHRNQGMNILGKCAKMCQNSMIWILL